MSNRITARPHQPDWKRFLFFASNRKYERCIKKQTLIYFGENRFLSDQLQFLPRHNGICSRISAKYQTLISKYISAIVGYTLEIICGLTFSLTVNIFWNFTHFVKYTCSEYNISYGLCWVYASSRNLLRKFYYYHCNAQFVTKYSDYWLTRSWDLVKLPYKQTDRQTRPTKIRRQLTATNFIYSSDWID